MSRLIAVFLLGMLSMVSGQDAWGSGSISFNYGNPFPNEAVEYAGDLLSTDIPAHGAGGFAVAMGDTNILALVAYDIHVTASDTLADIFTIIIQDTAEIQAGSHTIEFGGAANNLFLWMQDVDPEIITMLVDTSFAFDSLEVLNPYLSISGQIDIEEINETSITGSFAGTMTNTNLDFMMISGGTFTLANNLPELSYNQGSLSITSDSNVRLIEGELNPLQSAQGVGGLEMWQGDTLSTSFFAYTPSSAGNGLDVFGMTFRGLPASYPETGGQKVFTVGPAPIDLPAAMPFYLENISAEQFSLLLAGDSLLSLDTDVSLFLPGGVGTVTLGYDLEGSAWISLPQTQLTNTQGMSLTLAEEWSLSSSGLTGLEPAKFQHPSEKSLVGSAFPNPFNSSTVIPFELNTSTPLDLGIYNLLGEQVVELHMGGFEAGAHRYHLNLGAYELPGGLYIFRIKSATRPLGTGSFIYLK